MSNIIKIALLVYMAFSAVYAEEDFTGKITSLLASGTNPAIKLTGNITPKDCSLDSDGWIYFDGNEEQKDQAYSNALTLSLAGKTVAISLVSNNASICVIKYISVNISNNIQDPSEYIQGSSVSTTGTFTLSWDNSLGFDHIYSLYEKIDGQIDDSFIISRSLEAGNTVPFKKVIKGKAPGIYSYYIIACSENSICSDPSDTKIVTVTLPPPNNPGNISGPSNSTTGTFDLTWSNSTGLSDIYKLYENGNYIISRSLQAGNTNPFKKVIRGKASGVYRYHIIACNSQNICSDPSWTKVVTVTLPPNRPGSISGPSSSIIGTFNLYWGNSTGLSDIYKLYENGRYIVSRSLAAGNTAPFKKVIRNKLPGRYNYYLLACNTKNLCSARSQTKIVTVK